MSNTLNEILNLLGELGMRNGVLAVKNGPVLGTKEIIIEWREGDRIAFRSVNIDLAPLAAIRGLGLRETLGEQIYVMLTQIVPRPEENWLVREFYTLPPSETLHIPLPGPPEFLELEPSGIGVPFEIGPPSPSKFFISNSSD
jgi:hypothetical protein